MKRGLDEVGVEQWLSVPPLSCCRLLSSCLCWTRQFSKQASRQLELGSYWWGPEVSWWRLPTETCFPITTANEQETVLLEASCPLWVTFISWKKTVVNIGLKKFMLYFCSFMRIIIVGEKESIWSSWSYSSVPSLLFVIYIPEWEYFMCEYIWLFVIQPDILCYFCLAEMVSVCLYYLMIT